MKTKEFIEKLKGLNPEAEILVSCDEELNTIYSGIEAEYLEDESRIVIWGNSGSETE